VSPSHAEALLDLVGRVYDVATSRDGWEPVLERMTALFGGRATVFFVRDHRAVDTVFLRYWGLPDEMLREAAERFATMDLGLDGLLTVAPGTIVTDDADPSRVDPRSDALLEYLERWDVERYLGCDLFRDARRFGVIVVLGSRRRAPFGAGEIALLEALVPHLRRAVELRSRLDREDAHRSVAQQVIEGMMTGVVLLGANGQVLTANASARRITRSRDGLRIAGGRLRADAPAEDALLQKAIREAIAISEQRDAEGAAALTVSRSARARPYAVVVSPGARAAEPSAGRIASAIVLIGDPDSSLAAAEAIAMQVYGLTPSEARLACAVASGESLESYAAARGIKVSTARWTMKQALAKAGAQRQADLVRILLTGPAALATRGGRDE